jgi:hypothetical protein
MRGNRNVGGCPSGGGGGETKNPQERYDLIFLSISTELYLSSFFKAKNGN